MTYAAILRTRCGCERKLEVYGVDHPPEILVVALAEEPKHYVDADPVVYGPMPR